jgi:hypothetical protein
LFAFVVVQLKLGTVIKTESLERRIALQRGDECEIVHMALKNHLYFRRQDSQGTRSLAAWPHKPVSYSKLMIKNLRVLPVQRKERALHRVSSNRGTLLSSGLSSVSFIPSPLCIAVQSDTSIEPADTHTTRVLSPVFCPKLERSGECSF